MSFDLKKFLYKADKTIHSSISRIGTSHQCVMCSSSGVGASYKSIPLPESNASRQEQLCYESSICIECVERLRMVLTLQ